MLRKLWRWLAPPAAPPPPDDLDDEVGSEVDAGPSYTRADIVDWDDGRGYHTVFAVHTTPDGAVAARIYGYSDMMLAEVRAAQEQARQEAQEQPHRETEAPVPGEAEERVHREADESASRERAEPAGHEVEEPEAAEQARPEAEEPVTAEEKAEEPVTAEEPAEEPAEELPVFAWLSAVHTERGDELHRT